MSERGVFAVDRGVFEHDCFADEPFTEREAWMWLIGAVAWKEKTVRVGKFVATVKRGQGAFSIRFLADKWQWSKSRVDRFFDRLKNRDMIGTQSGTGITIITICNYSEYQRVSLPDRDSSGTQTGTAAGQQRDKEEDIESIEVEKKDIDQPDDWPEDFREVFWAAYPRKVGKQGALRELDRVRRKSVSFEKLISAVRGYAATADPEFTKHPQTWLSKGCWDDEPDVRKPNGQSSVLAAADRLIDRIRQFDAPAPGEQRRLCSGESPVVVRPIPEGGCERPGYLRGVDSGDPVGLPAGNDALRDGPEDWHRGKPAV